MSMEWLLTIILFTKIFHYKQLDFMYTYVHTVLNVVACCCMTDCMCAYTLVLGTILERALCVDLFIKTLLVINKTAPSEITPCFQQQKQKDA